MKFIIYIPVFFIFLYSLFKLIKDDHVFLRRNIKIELFFDIAIISTIAGFFFAQLFSLLNNLSLTLFIVGAFMSLFILGKYRKLPIGRLFDFFILSFMTALPFGYLIASISTTKANVIYFLVSLLLYLLTVFIFRRWLLRKIMNRTLKEGILSLIFAITYSIFSLCGELYFMIVKKSYIVNIESIILIILFTVSVVLLGIQNRGRVYKR